MKNSITKGRQKNPQRTTGSWRIWPRVLVVLSILMSLLLSAYISIGVTILLFGLGQTSIHEYWLMFIATATFSIFQWLVWRKSSLGKAIRPLWSSGAGDKMKAVRRLAIGAAIGVLFVLVWGFAGNSMGNIKVLSLAKNMSSNGFAMTTDDLGRKSPGLNVERANLASFLKENKKSIESISLETRKLLRDGSRNEKDTQRIASLLVEHKSLMLVFVRLLKRIREPHLFDVKLAKELGSDFYWGNSIPVASLARLLMLDARNKAISGDVHGAFEGLALATKAAMILANEPIWFSKIMAQGFQRDVTIEYLRLASDPNARNLLEKETEPLRRIAKRDLFIEGRQNYGVFAYEQFLMHVHPDLWDEWIRKLNKANEDQRDELETPKRGVLWKISAWFSGGLLIDHLIAADSFQLNYEICTNSEGLVWERSERYVEAAKKSVMSLLLGGPEKLAFTTIFRQEKTFDWLVDIIPLVAAAHIYRDDHDEFPANPNDIAPYLENRTLFADPMSRNGDSIFFVRKLDKLTIYSVGENGQDDGGNFKERMDIGFVLESRWY